MTESEAIKILKNNEERKTSGRYIIIKNMSIKALEKQIPKKPTKDYLVPGLDFCPTCCGTEVTGCEYCPNCGQAIDWDR